MKSFFDTETQKEVLQRIDKLNNNTKAQKEKITMQTFKSSLTQFGI